VIQKKTPEKDGYAAYQIGFGSRRAKHTTRPLGGHFAKAGVDPTRYVREVRYDEGDLEVGQLMKVDMFQVGQKIDVTGISRGLGFAGGMKRHHFSGANKTHGQSDRWRAPGSIGQSSYPSRVFKGLRMAGRLGKDTVTVRNLEIMQIIADENLMLVKGAVPGHRGSLVKVRSTNRA
jgi:large subunit ribosomal protein L3